VVDLAPRKLSAFVRVDRYTEACPDCSGIDFLPIATNAPFTMVLAGVEYFVVPSVRFSPNIEWVGYDSPVTGSEPKNDAVARLTFYWTW
jgi:hypothetical protein